MSWWIKGKDDTVKAVAHALEYNGEWMGESYVSVTIESPTPIAFAIGDYLMYRDERFEINYDPGKIKSAPQFAKGDAFKYENVKFNSLADELTRCDFLDVVLSDNQLHFTGLPKFSFYGGVQDLANRIQANLNRAYPNQWTVVVSSDYTGDKELNVSIDTQKVWDALSILVNDFEAYFTIKGRTITIGAAGVPAGHLFKYGKGNGLYEIEQNAEADQAIVTRLRAYGSTRNLPHRYYNKLTSADGKKLIPDNMAVQYLMLPSFPYTTQDPYIDSVNKAALGIREGTIFFDGSQEELEEIYPSIEGMTAEQLKAAGVPCDATGALDVVVSAEQMTDDGVGKINEENSQPEATPPTFKVTLKDLGFDIWEHRTSETPTISFKTGMLGGRDFDIVNCKKEGNNYVLELNRVYDDSIKLWFPYKNYNAKGSEQNTPVPDTFVLLNIKMPEVYVKAAAQRLLEAATAWLAKNDYSRSIYAPKVDEIFMARQHDEAIASGGSIISLHDTLKEGMLLLFEDDDLNIDASIFIDRLTIKEGNGSVPTYEVVLKEEKTVGRLDKMQNQIDSLTSGKGQGGYTASQIRQMIDAYGGQRFLSKLKDDRSKGKIASDLGVEVGNYLAGVSGGMLGLDTNNGESFADVFRLWVRGKAYFETLTTMESKTLAGKQYITPGGSIRCTKVEEVKNAQGAVTDYRCYFLSEQDGEKTDTKIVVGDQAISEMFNAKTGVPNNKLSNHRYWRLVTSVNNDAYSDDADNHYGYIDLSAVDCESDSDIPKEGDIIEQFGNRTDATRQSAMVFSTVDPDSPSIKMFAGIGSGATNSEHYSLNNKAIISFGRDAATGKVYFRLGATDATQFLDYKQDEGLTLNGKLSVNTTIGDKTIDEYFADKAEAATDKYKYLKEALADRTTIDGGLLLTSLIRLGRDNSDATSQTVWSGLNGVYTKGRDISFWAGGDAVDLFLDNDLRKTAEQLTGLRPASSLIRMDGSAYWANGNVGFRKDGSGWLASDNITWDANGAITFGNGIKIDLDGDAKGLTDSIASVTNLANAISNLFTPYNGTTARTWQDVLNGADFDAVKVERAFFTDFSLAGKGLSPAGGSGGGGGSLFGLYTDTTWVSVPAEDDALSAVLGKSLHARVSVLEGAGYLTGITKAMVEAVLTGDITSHTHSQYIVEKTAAELTGLTIKSGADSKIVLNNTDTDTKYQMISFRQSDSEYGWLGTAGDNNLMWNGYTLLHTGNYASTLDSRYVTLATAQNISGVKTFTGGLHLKMGNNFANYYNDGLRIHVCGSEQWASLLFCGADNTGDAGTSANSWGLFVHDGAFGIGRNGNGISSGTSRLWCDADNTWNISGLLKIGSLNVASNALVANLNAELLGGMTNNQVRKNTLGFTPTVVSTSSGNCDLDLLKEGMARNYWGTDKWVHAPEGFGFGAAVVFAPFGYTNLHGQLAWDVNHLHDNVTRNLYWRVFATATGGTDKWGGWRQIAFTDSNVASATKLQTARSIWGQSFDGTASISGELQHVTALRFDSGNALVEGLGNAWNLWSVNGFQFFPTMSATVSALSITANGRVGVNMYAPAYDFDVTGVIHASGEICSAKSIGGKGMTSSSDIRLKHIIGDVELSFESILNSPSKRFTWLGDTTKTERIGTIAQYWLPILPQVVYTAADGYYAVDYGALANAKADTIAHVVADLVERLNKLESQLNSRA